MNHDEIAQSIEALKGDYEQREAARERLVEAGADAVPLLMAVAESEQGRAAVEAVKVLGQLADPRAFELLLATMRSQQALLSVTAVSAVRAYTDRDVMPELVAALPDACLMAQQSLVLALDENNDPASVPGLVAFLAKTDQPLIRCAIIQTLGRLGDDALVPVIAPYVDDENHHVRDWAAEVIQRWGVAM